MIRQVRTDEFERVRDYYWKHIDDMEGAEYNTKWAKGIYPSDDDLKDAVESRELYLYEEDGVILSSMRLNHSVTEGYDRIKWSVDAAPEEVTIIHMLCVAVASQGKGIARKMLRFAMDKARAEGQKCIRLDVLNDNVPAFRLYESEGFKVAGTVQLFYEDTGLADFVLYEYNL